MVSLHKVVQMAKHQKYPLDKIVVSHQDLGRMEWPFTKELVKQQADLYGLKTVYSKRRDKNGYEETLLEYVLRRGKWPSSDKRWCTSDFKRGPGARVVTALTKNLGSCKVLYVFGFRKDESPARAKKEPLKLNKMLTTKKRVVYDWLPIHHWDEERVWYSIKTNNLPYHYAYDLGIPRLSCCFCIFSPFDALVLAGRANRKLLDEYVEVEEITGHKFREDCWLSDVRDAVDLGYVPSKVSGWAM